MARRFFMNGLWKQRPEEARPWHKRTEEPFGKTVGGLARPMLRGAARLGFKFTLTMAAYDLIRLPKLLGALV
jgi:hypothetical protein